MFNFHYTLYEQISSSWSQAVVWRCSIKKFLKIPESFFRESRYLIACDIVKKGTPVQRFLCEFCWIFKNIYFVEQLWIAATVIKSCIHAFMKRTSRLKQNSNSILSFCAPFLSFLCLRGGGGHGISNAWILSFEHQIHRYIACKFKSLKQKVFLIRQ